MLLLNNEANTAVKGDGFVLKSNFVYTAMICTSGLVHNVEQFLNMFYKMPHKIREDAKYDRSNVNRAPPTRQSVTQYYKRDRDSLLCLSSLYCQIPTLKHKRANAWKLFISYLQITTSELCLFLQ